MNKIPVDEGAARFPTHHDREPENGGTDLEVFTQSDAEFCMSLLEAGEPQNARQRRLEECVNLWQQTKGSAGFGWPDLSKSRLFWRIRAGLPVLPDPPPTAFSCPWYEVIEEDRPHWSNDVQLRDDEWLGGAFKDTVGVCQCHYKINEKLSETEYVVSFNRYRFRLWKDAEAGARTVQAMNPHRPDTYERYLKRFTENPNEGWFIQIVATSDGPGSPSKAESTDAPPVQNKSALSGHYEN